MVQAFVVRAESVFPSGELVTTPLFDGDESYIAYPPLTNIHDDLRVQVEFKPLERDGLMFFCGGKKMKVEDFVSISMVDGHVEFRYELGTGNVSAPTISGRTVTLPPGSERSLWKDAPAGTSFKVLW